MQKLFRSLIAIGGLAGLVACGDDVSVVAPSDPLTISGAPVTAISIGSKVQLSASEAATWASSDATVASVDGTGLVTAIKGGVASITATATADVNKKASVTITVTALVNAAISVQNITVTGTPGNTVNNNNVAGSIDVNLNVVPGDQVVQRVEVLLDGNVACTQNLSGAQAAVAADVEGVDAVIVSCQINTAAFSATTGVANFANGSHTLSARAIITGGTQVATPSTPLIFNNQSGVIATITNTNGTDAAAAINPGTGLQWIGGGVVINFVGVSYVANTTIASVSCQIFGKSPVVTLTAGIGTVTWTETSTAWSSTNSQVGGYLSPAAESISCPSAVLSNGQPLVVAGGTTPLLNFGAPGMTNAAMPALQVLRLDNTAPGATSANGVVQTLVSTLVVPMTLPWVNATTTLTPSATGSGTNTLGLPSLATLNAATGATDVEEGVDNITVTVNVPAAGGALPTTGGSCNIAGLTAVTVGSNLAETTVSSAFPARIVFKDALGNQTCLDLVQAFGADFTAPTASITAGPVANTGYNASPLPAWQVSASDNASGFSATPLRVLMTRLNANGSTSCVLGSGSSCTTPSQQGLTFSATGGSATEGYYTTTFTILDAAGNSASLISSQLNELDTTLPTFVGGISLPSVIAGAATNTFTTSVADNLDLGSVFGLVSYPVGVLIQYPTQQIGTFGPALEQSASVGYAVSNWIRCLNAAGSFAVASGQPTGIQLSLRDQTTVAANTATLASAAFGANAQVCTGPGIEGAVGNITGINSFIHNAPVYGTGLTQVDLDGQTVANISSTSVALQAVADVALNSSADPFSRVDFYYVNTAGNLVKIGTATAVLAQTQTNRTYTYSLTFDPAPPVQTGNVTVVAIGVDAQGDAVFATNAQVVVIVP